MTFTLQAPLFDQFQRVKQSGASMMSMRPARDSISNRQSTSPPSISKLAVALSVMFSKVYFPSSTTSEAVGALPIKMDSDAALLLRLASAVMFSSGSTVNDICAVPMVMLLGTSQSTSRRSSL